MRYPPLTWNDLFEGLWLCIYQVLVMLRCFASNSHDSAFYIFRNKPHCLPVVDLSSLVLVLSRTAPVPVDTPTHAHRPDRDVAGVRHVYLPGQLAHRVPGPTRGANGCRRPRLRVFHDHRRRV